MNDSDMNRNDHLNPDCHAAPLEEELGQPMEDADAEEACDGRDEWVEGQPEWREATGPLRERRSFPLEPYGHVPEDYLPAEALDDRPPAPQSTHHNKDLGKRGEDAAARFLVHKGFTILERNWTCPAGEADIIAERFDDEGCHEIHFIEVKTRTSTCTGFPEEAVNKEKRRRYEKITEMYLRDHDVGEAMVTFDIIALLVTKPDRAFMRMHTNVLLRDAW